MQEQLSKNVKLTDPLVKDENGNKVEKTIAEIKPGKDATVEFT